MLRRLKIPRSGSLILIAILIITTALTPFLPIPQPGAPSADNQRSLISYIPGDDAYYPLGTEDLTSEAAFVADLDTGVPMYATDEHERRPVGSIVKVFTALVVLQYIDDPAKAVVVIQDSDMVETGYTSMGLVPGDTLTVEQLLYGLLLPSGGDAALALSRYVGSIISGSEDPDVSRSTFVDAMNEFAAENDLSDSRFANSDGRDDDEAYTSAADVFAAMQMINSNEILARVIRSKSYEFTSVGQEERNYSGNSTFADLIGTDGILGGKTGSEEKAGGNAAVLRETNGGRNTVVIVVLGAMLTYDLNYVPIVDTRWNDVEFFIEDMDNVFTWIDIAKDPSFLIFLPKIEALGFVVTTTPFIPVPRTSNVELGYSAYLDYDWTHGYPETSMIFFIGNTRVGTSPVETVFQQGWIGGSKSKELVSQ